MIDYEALLPKVKNYLNITYDDAPTDEKLTDIMKRSADYMLHTVGAAGDDLQAFTANQTIWFDHIRYAFNHAGEFFFSNYAGEINAVKGLNLDDI